MRVVADKTAADCIYVRVPDPPTLNIGFIPNAMAVEGKLRASMKRHWCFECRNLSRLCHQRNRRGIGCSENSIMAHELRFVDAIATHAYLIWSRIFRRRRGLMDVVFSHDERPVEGDSI